MENEFLKHLDRAPSTVEAIGHLLDLHGFRPELKIAILLKVMSHVLAEIKNLDPAFDDIEDRIKRMRQEMNPLDRDRTGNGPGPMEPFPHTP